MSSEFIKSLCALDSLKVSISGVRGIFGDDLNINNIIHFCRNFSNLIESGKCVLARDTRPSSKICSDVACASLMERGISVFNLGISPTPVAFRESRKYGSGLIITSSHNPLEWNGLKFILHGRGINDLELSQLNLERSFPKKKIAQESEIHSNYVKEAVNLIKKTSARPNVVIDVGGGAAFKVAPQLLEQIGCKVKKINCIPGKSSRGPDPTDDELSELTKSSQKADIGFAFDLDGDRLVVVKDGRKQAPDITLGLGVAKVLSMGYRKFVLSIDTSVAVEKFIEHEGGKVTRSKVGEANVVDTMLKTNSHAGGEGSSAGFILPEFNFCRDGLLTSGLIASMTGTKEFSEIVNFMQGYFQLRTKINVDSRYHLRTIEILKKKMKPQFSQIITLDGTKAIVDEDSWTLVRQSNTEYAIRVSSESNKLSKAKLIEKQILELVKQSYDEARRIRNH